MLTKTQKLLQWAFSITLLPFLAGCGGGGGVAALGSLFASLGPGALDASTGFLPLGGESVAVVTQPEPASMLLLGSGLIALSRFRGKN